MRLYQAKEGEEFTDSLIRMLEQDTQKTIFTIRILRETDEGLKTLIVFEDKNVLLAFIKVEEIKGKLAIRMKGNFV